MKLLEGKKILVVGVANERSIAWGIARALHDAGATVALSGVKSHVRRLTRMGREIGTDLILECDVGDDAQINQLFVDLGTAWDGVLDGLIHSVAFANLDDLEGEYINTSRDGYMLAQGISAYSLVSMARAARPLMRGRGGSIVTLTFSGSHRVVPNYNVMGPAKAALESSVKYLAHDLGKDAIRVNAISAGAIRTSSAMAVKGFEKSREVLGANLPLGRNLTADDMGGPAVFLCSSMASAVTGTILAVDGGMVNMAGVFQTCSVCPNA